MSSRRGTTILVANTAVLCATLHVVEGARGVLRAANAEYTVGYARTVGGDVDGDTDVDLRDFSYWPECVTGPGSGPHGAGCDALDLEGDTDIDLDDFAGFQTAFRETLCGDGVLESPEQCDDGVGNSDTEPDACRTNCRAAWCGDGVLDTGEDCDDGASNSDTEPDACRTDCTPASCGDGVIDTGEDCDDGNPFNGDGCRYDCTLEICGDEIVDPNEDCDPPDGTFCDVNCQYVIAGTLSADECGDATSGNSEGYFLLDNFLATLDGPSHAACVNPSDWFYNEDQVDNDVWTCWTSPCTSTVVVETCDLATIDTRIAVYEGCDCPVTDARLLTCKDDECGLQTIAAFAAIEGQDYLIRAGTYPPRPGGYGLVKASCGVAGCPGTGDCFAANGTPGCSDQPCCETMCLRDSYCCEVEWDDTCAEEAQWFCAGGTGFPACAPGAGSCADPSGNGTPGCDDVECCNAVCRVDLECCLTEWDDICAYKEAMLCRSSCGPGAGDCFTENGTPGCEDEACCAEVCPRDEFCCQIGWDQECTPLAFEYCQ